MFYEFDLTIPANTSQDTPAEVEAVMASGIVTKVEVQLPRGLRSLVHTVAVRGVHQLWPSNPDGDIKGDGARIAWGEEYDLTEPPHSVKLRGWSPDTYFSHVITWRFTVHNQPPREAVKPRKRRGIFGALMNKGAS